MNKKIFLTLFIFIGFLFLFNCDNVFASYDVELEGKTYTLPDLPIDDDSNKYYLLTCDRYEGGSIKIFRLYTCAEPFKWINYSDNCFHGIYCDSYTLTDNYRAR